MAKGERKFVLSIDGGGFRGYSCLIILNYLMENLGPTGNSPLPCQLFDVICGTSTGGLIAILLGRFGMDCPTAMSAYVELVTALFADVDQQTTDSIVSGERDFPDAFNERLATIVEKYTGDKSVLMETSKKRPDKVSHSSTDTFVTVVQFTTGAAGVEPYHVRSCKTPPGGVESVPNHNWTVYECICAAMALPGFFKPVDVGPQTFQDASLSGSANPVRGAISEVKLRWPESQPVIFSLGTGVASLSFAEESSESEQDRVVVGVPGPVGLFRSGAFSKQLMAVSRDTNLAHQGAMAHFGDMNMGFNYFRLDPTRGLGDLHGPDVSNITRIEALTIAWMRTPVGRDKITRAYRALKARFKETQIRSGPQHSVADSNPVCTKSSIVRKIQPPSVVQRDSERQDNNQQPLEVRVSESDLKLSATLSQDPQVPKMQSDICSPEKNSKPSGDSKGTKSLGDPESRQDLALQGGDQALNIIGAMNDGTSKCGGRKNQTSDIRVRPSALLLLATALFLVIVSFRTWARG